MPFSRWLSGGRPGLRDRVVKALQQARDGDADGAIDTIAERFSEALGELQSLRQPVDPGWLRLAARIAYRAADNYVYSTVRHFLTRRHKVSSHGTTRFPAQVVFGQLGVLRLRHVHIGAPS